MREIDFLQTGFDFYLSSAELMINGYLVYSEVDSDNFYTAGYSKGKEREEIKTKDKSLACICIETYLNKIKEKK